MEPVRDQFISLSTEDRRYSAGESLRATSNRRCKSTVFDDDDDDDDDDDGDDVGVAIAVAACRGVLAMKRTRPIAARRTANIFDWLTA